jgi:phenolic acid decarboxylase
MTALAEPGYPIGEKWIFDIGVAEIEHHYVSSTQMRYRILTGSRAGEVGQVELQIQPVRGALYFVSWQESDRSTVVHLEDFSNCTFISCFTSPEAEFFRIQGRMRRAT